MTIIRQEQPVLSRQFIKCAAIGFASLIALAADKAGLIDIDRSETTHPAIVTTPASVPPAATVK